MTKINAYFERKRQEAIDQNIETDINAIVEKCRTLSYQKQLETINRIKENLLHRKNELNNELQEIEQIINKL